MKNLKSLGLFLMLTITSLAFFSCNDENGTVSNNDLNNRFQKESINSVLLSSNIQNGFTKNGKLLNKNSYNFNFESITKITDTETGNISYMVDSADEKIKLGVYEKGKDSFDFLIVETNEDGIYKNMIYKNIDGQNVAKISLNTQTEKISTYTYENKSSNTRGWGQDTIDCITDGYSNHGWVSVTGWVITAFQPWFAVGMAAGCAAHTY